jgi:hypothetical protein
LPRFIDTFKYSIGSNSELEINKRESEERKKERKTEKECVKIK